MKTIDFIQSTVKRTKYYPGQCFKGSHNDLVARVACIVKGIASDAELVIESITKNGSVSKKIVRPDECKYIEKHEISEKEFMMKLKGMKLIIDEDQKLDSQSGQSSTDINSSDVLKVILEHVTDIRLQTNVTQSSIGSLNKKIDQEHALKGITDQYEVMSQKLDEASTAYEEMKTHIKQFAEAL